MCSVDNGKITEEFSVIFSRLCEYICHVRGGCFLGQKIFLIWADISFTKWGLHQVLSEIFLQLFILSNLMEILKNDRKCICAGSANEIVQINY